MGPSVLTRFVARVTEPGGMEGHRTYTVMVQIPPHVRAWNGSRFLSWLHGVVAEDFVSNYAQFGEMSGDGTRTPDLYLDPATSEPDVEIVSTKRMMEGEDIYRVLARGPDDDRATVLGRWDYHRSMRAYGYLDDVYHRAFRYHIEGINVKTLMQLIPPELDTEHFNAECDHDRMCVYRMLRDRNPPTSTRKFEEFEPDAVRRWVHDNVDPSIEKLTDGLAPEHIQAHALHHRYPHAALDITRGIVCLHIPTREERHKHFKTIAYTIVGNHVIPFTDPPAIESIMNSASQRIGRRRACGYSNMVPGDPTASRSKSCGASSAAPPGNTTMQVARKRSRSLDTIFRPDPHRSLAEEREQTWSEHLPLDVDIQFEDRVEEFVDTGRSDQLSVSPPSSRRRNGLPPMEYPLATDDSRFQYFTKADGKDFVRQRLRPTYQEGSLGHLIHYFVCTDEDNIEFLYDYCIHVLSWDPTTTARSYAGHCQSLRIQNVIWLACPDVDILRRLHGHLHPKEPIRMTGLATYAWRMLTQEMSRVGRFGTNLWDCMSQYPPNLQRLLDNHHPYHRPVLLTRTYHPPYGNPHDTSSAVPSDVPTTGVKILPVTTSRMDPALDTPLQVPEWIPMEERQRVDLIRSYTATILKMADDRDEYPIHDLTNRLIPYDPTNLPSGPLPIGHYLVDLPTQAQRQARGTRELWERLPCFAPDGEPRMMSHRMVRNLLDRGLIVTEDIRLMCLTATSRQRRFGAALVTGLVNLVHRVYRMEILQDVRDRTVKSLVNQLIGVCNGTTVPYTGNRFVFRNLEECYQLMLKVYTDDQLTRCQLNRCSGRDPYWDNREFFHYELSTGGYSNKPFHLQPVYSMVLEDQAIRMYDILKPIPLTNLIQVKVDAVEYRVRPSERNDAWVQDMRLAMIDPALVTENRMWLEKNWIGRYKAEAVKGPEKWFLYYQRNHTGSGVRIQHYRPGEGDPLFDVHDPESQDYIPDWKAAMIVVQPGVQVREAGYATDHWVEWFQTHSEDRIGMIVTGPAGTGKTHLLKACYDTATRLGKRVVRTAFTHAACVQLGYDAVTLSHLFGLDARDNHRSTLVMSRSFAARLRTLQLDILMVDEISMLPLDILECLVMFHRIHTQTRLILSGDFNQLPPVESYGFDTVWTPTESTVDRNYFEQTDIYPYLVYDRTLNRPGEWTQLTECMRTDDPLLQAICLDPSYVVTRLDPQQFPVKPNVPMWRFLCHTNLTRKACNWFCMQRWLDVHPDAPAYAFDLREVYVTHHVSLSKRFDASYYGQQYDQMVQNLYTKKPAVNQDEDSVTSVPEKNAVTTRYVPRHWQYLQSFVYGVGMEVISRNTIQSKSQNIDVVNNRRAVIQSLDVDRRTVTIQWMDVIQRQALQPDGETNGDPEPLCLTFYDFAFNFVPGFCTTCHLAQGETIREHYGILDWNNIRRDAKMAYVAVTRASHPDFLHICANYFTDPWESRGNGDVATNVIRKLYHLFKTDFTRSLPMEYAPLMLTHDWVEELSTTNNTLLCDECQGPLKVRLYMDNDLTQFNFMVRFPYAENIPSRHVSLPAAWSSVTATVPTLHRRVLRCVCKACHNTNIDKAVG